MAVVQEPAEELRRGSRATVRLTTSQALIRFLTAQYSVRDGERRRLIPGVYGIFGHGNTGGIGQAISALPPGELFFLEGRNEQAMVHAAAAFAKASRRTATLACTSSIGLGALNMLVAAAGDSGIGVWLPLTEEAAAVRELLAQGWAVSPGERYRFHSAPGLRITTADLEPEEAERLADAIAALRRASSSTYAG